eukprot:2157684-Rhodomonas_salina.1
MILKATSLGKGGRRSCSFCSSCRYSGGSLRQQRRRERARERGRRRVAVSGGRRRDEGSKAKRERGC